MLPSPRSELMSRRRRDDRSAYVIFADLYELKRVSPPDEY